MLRRVSGVAGRNTGSPFNRDDDYGEHQTHARSERDRENPISRFQVICHDRIVGCRTS